MTTALVLIDFINDIIHPDGKVAKFGTPQHAADRNVIPNTKRVLEKARSDGTKIIWVRVCFSEGHPELANSKAPFYVAHRENNWLVRDTWGTEFHAELQPIDGEVIVEKSRINPFSNPLLEKELDGVDRVVVAGVSTNLAVEEMVRNGAARDLEIVVLEDCCASNNQDVHQFAVDFAFTKFAAVSSSAEFLTE